MTVREARNRMMRNMATTIERIPQANRALQQCMVDIAPIAAHMGNPGITAAVRIAMEGQLLLNRVGFALAEAHDVRDAHDAGDWRPFRLSCAGTRARMLVRGLCEGMERDKPTIGTASHSGNRVESSRRASTNQQINHQTNPQEISKTKTSIQCQ